MKKKKLTLTLSRETLRHLEERSLDKAKGGIPSEPFTACHSDQWSDCASPTCDPNGTEVVKRV